MSQAKNQILREIDELMRAIKDNLHKSILLNNKKKLPAIAQPKLLKGGELKDYQLESLAWMIQLANNNLSGILADDMGLGKTIQTIAYLTYVQQTHGIKGKHLIIVPKNVLNNWKRQLQTWNPTLSVVILPGTETQRQEVIQKYILTSKFDVLITTYYAVQVAERTLKRFHWETMIVDEAHSIKNDETCLATCLRRFKFKFALLLTGTPLSNELKQLWSLLNFIAPQIFDDSSLFKRIQDSVNSDCKDDEQKIKYQSEIAGRFKAIISPFLLRRVKGEVKLGLKEKKQFTLFVSLTELQLKLYRNYLKTKSVYGDEHNVQLSAHIQLRKICAHPYLFSDIEDPKAPPYGQHLIQNCGKLKLLDKLLQKLLKQGHKILIFSQFVVLIKILEDFCTYRQYKYCAITGESSLEQRDNSVEAFSKSKDTNIFLISTRAGGVGLNLVAADVVIIYDLDWNPQMDKQAMDRAYRIGQKKNVMVFKLISNNTVEERMLQVQKYKLIWDQLVIQKGGLGRMKAAQEKFEKIDQNYIAGLGVEQIFKLQQNFDDKTIEEIIKFGMEKDISKTQEIRTKLQKQFEKYGEIANPYETLQRNKSNIDDIEYKAQRLNQQKAKSHKPNWKQRQNMKNNFIQPKAYHFFEDTSAAGRLLFQLEQTQDEQEKQNIRKKLCQVGFYNWRTSQFKQFVEANMKYFKEDYKNIAKKIGTKTVAEVMAYSDKYFKTAEHIASLKIDYAKIMRKQKDLERERELKQMEEAILKYPNDLFYLKKPSSGLPMNNESMTRLYFNGMKQNGICLEECEKVLQLINPKMISRFKRSITGINKNHLYTKVVQQLTKENPEDVEEQLRAKYQQLRKTFNKKTNAKHEIIEVKSEQNEDSAQTAIKNE